MTKFASDEVAVIAKNPTIAAALAARARLDAAFAAQDAEATAFRPKTSLSTRLKSSRAA
jgi:hypothetical protein